MIDYSLLIYVLFLATLLFIGVKVGIAYAKLRTKYTLTTLILITIVFIDTTLHLLRPRWLGELIPGYSNAAHSLLSAVLIILFLAFFFYPDTRKFLYQRKMKNPDSLEIEFQKRLKQSPQDTELLYKYANFLWYVRKDYDEAEGYFQQAVELAPKNVSVLYN